MHLPAGGKGLDVGCGSGALTIACARKNPQGFMFGIDKWGKEYHSYNKELCENNASAEGAYNPEFSSVSVIAVKMKSVLLSVLLMTLIH